MTSIKFYKSTVWSVDQNAFHICSEIISQSRFNHKYENRLNKRQYKFNLPSLSDYQWDASTCYFAVHVVPQIFIQREKRSMCTWQARQFIAVGVWFQWGKFQKFFSLFSPCKLSSALVSWQHPPFPPTAPHLFPVSLYWESADLLKRQKLIVIHFWNVFFFLTFGLFQVTLPMRLLW